MKSPLWWITAPGFVALLLGGGFFLIQELSTLPDVLVPSSFARTMDSASATGTTDRELDRTLDLNAIVKTSASSSGYVAREIYQNTHLGFEMVLPAMDPLHETEFYALATTTSDPLLVGGCYAETWNADTRREMVEVNGQTFCHATTHQFNDAQTSRADNWTILRNGRYIVLQFNIHAATDPAASIRGCGVRGYRIDQPICQKLDEIAYEKNLERLIATFRWTR